MVCIGCTLLEEGILGILLEEGKQTWRSDSLPILLAVGRVNTGTS